MSAALATGISCLTLLLVLVAVQVAVLLGTNKRRVLPIGIFGLAWRAALGVVAGCIVGSGLAFAIMFGPSYLADDFIALPWITMLPALGVGFLATIISSHMLSRGLVLLAKPSHLKRAAG